jgi:spore germination protein YaaH
MRISFLCLLAIPAFAPAQAPEAIWYIRNSEAGIASFASNASHISVIAPQVYSMDSTGAIRGGTDPRIVAIARAHGVKLVPLVMNPGFSVSVLHQIATIPAVRTNAARSLAALCRSEKLHGIQLDFENLHVSDRDAFTALAREAVDSVHRAGCELSAAVVPRTDDQRGVLPYHHYLYDYWRGAYDFKALANTLDFISYMTYAQHTGGSTPGPVAGYPWMLASIKYVLDAGVPAHKISLGLASYSDYWTTAYNERSGSRAAGRDIGYVELKAIMDSAGVSKRWDGTQKSSTAVWERHGVFEHAWIEDARAFKEKQKLVRRFGFRGYSVWLLGTEDPHTWSIVGKVAK